MEIMGCEDQEILDYVEVTRSCDHIFGAESNKPPADAATWSRAVFRKAQHSCLSWCWRSQARRPQCFAIDLPPSKKGNGVGVPSRPPCPTATRDVASLLPAVGRFPTSVPKDHLLPFQAQRGRVQTFHICLSAAESDCNCTIYRRDPIVISQPFPVSTAQPTGCLRQPDRQRSGPSPPPGSGSPAPSRVSASPDPHVPAFA